MLQVCDFILISCYVISPPRAAATATGTEVAFTSESVGNELVQNRVLGKLVDCFTPSNLPTWWIQEKNLEMSS